MKIEKRLKIYFRSMFLRFGIVDTDKGALYWDNDQILRVGDEVYKEERKDDEADYEKADNGEYKAYDGRIIIVEDGIVKEIKQGNTTLSTDGFVSQMTANTDVIKVTASAGSTATQIIDATYAAIPDKAFERGDVVHIFVNPTLYRQYITEQNAICCANRNIIDAKSEELDYVGDSRVRIVPIRGLIGFNGAVAGARPNLVYGTDIEDSQAIYDLWFSRDADMFRLKVLFNVGTI